MPRRRNLAQQYLDVAGVIFLAIDADQRVSLVNKKAEDPSNPRLVLTRPGIGYSLAKPA